MPDINEYLKRKTTKTSATKKSDWDISSLVPSSMVTPTRPQRRPGRGEDSPALEAPTINPILNMSGPNLKEDPIIENIQILEKPNVKVEPLHEPKLSQSSVKLEPKFGQTRAKVEPNYKKIASNSAQLKKKVEPQLEPLHEPKLSQSSAKVEPNNAFSSLVGLQLNSLRYIFDSCRFRGSKISGPIGIQNLAYALNSTTAAVRKAIQRLEQKNFIARIGYKDGRGGWSEYQLTDDTYNSMLLNETRAKVEPNLSQTRAKVEPQLEPQLEPSLSSSSSFLDLKNFKTTTTEDVDKNGFELPHLNSDWQHVDFSSLSEIGFTQTHLVQIMRDGKLSSESVQDSIHYFAFDLNKNNKRKEINGQPLNFFMGILRRGMPYAAPANYESPLDQILRKNLEAKRLHSEKRSQMEAEIKEIEFEEWYSKLSEEEKLERVPMLPREGSGRKAAMRSQFDEYVWPELAQTVLGLTKIDRTEISKQIDQALQQEKI